MEYQIVDVKEKNVEGVLVRTENKDGKGIRDIGELWKEFFEQGKLGLIHGRTNENMIGLYTDYDGDFTQPYSYVAGCEVNGEGQAVFNRKKIAKGKYAKFVAKGDLQIEVGKIWNTVWGLPLNRNYKSDFEEYINSDGQTGEIHIYIGIEE